MGRVFDRKELSKIFGKTNLSNILERKFKFEIGKRSSAEFWRESQDDRYAFACAFGEGLREKKKER